MGLYWTKCTKCNRIWGFCSVSPMSIIGDPCNCGSEYHRPCDIHGNIESYEMEEKNI